MKMKKRLLSILLSIALVLGLMPGMSLTAYADEQTIVWEGEQAISDVNTVSIDKDKFSNIQLGDKLVVQFKDAAGELLQLKSNDAFLPGTDCGRLVFPDQSTYEAYATQAMIRSLKTYGLQVCGKDYTALKVWYEAGKDSMDENTVWSGYFWMDSWSTLELAATSFDGVDWDSVEAIRFISEAGRSDWTLNIRTSWEEDGKVADQSSMTWKDNYFELSLDEIDMAAKLENKDRLYIQGDKDGGEAFNFTQVQLVTVNEAVSEPENIIISPASGDIAEALAAAEEGKTVGDITINLTEGVTYTISNTIVVPASLTINGNGAIIDAGNLNAPMIALANIENPTQWTELNIAVSGLYVNGLKKQMFYSACKNYLCKTFTVDNCVVEVVADVITFDFTKGSVAESFVISNSTFYAPTATTKSLYSSQGGQKLTEYNGDTTQSFKLTHNTFFNLAPTKNFFVHRQNNQKWLSYEAKGNVFANCGKRGQVIIGLNGSGISANPTWDIDGNLFNYDGADTSATETTGDNNEPVKNSVAGVVTFVAPASGNFNGTLELSGGATLPEKLGDPRFTLSSHTHSFTYSASGATITATCTADGCDLPESSAGAGDHVATLTISASGGTYDGTTAYGATVTDPNGIQGEAKVQYQKKTGESYGTATETAPTDAGDYKASITVDGATASVEYTIAQADPTANAPTGLTATYGQTLVDVSLEGKNPGGNTPGTWAWADSTKSVGNVVTPAATFKAIFTPDSSNYKTVENVEVTVTVSKAENPATVTDTASVTAGGNIVDLAGNVTKNGATGDVSYAISGDANGCSLNGSVLTSGNTAGNVTVNVTVAADDNYNALAATPITVTINEKQTQTITADDVTVTYGDTGKSIAATSDGDGNLSYAVKSGDAVTVNETTGALTIVKAGSAVITVTAAETDAYAQATKDVNVTVDKADPIANAPTGLTASYGDTLADVSLEDKNPAGNTLGTWAWKDDTTEVGTVGSHTFKADFTPTDTTNYNSKSNVNVTVTVGKADPTATAPTATATYGQTLADVTLTNPTGNTAGTWAWADATTTSVGAVGSNTFKANFTPTDTTNYNSKSNVDVTVTVGKADNPATVTGTASVIEGGNTVDLAANVTKNGAAGDVSYAIIGEANGCSMNGSVLTSGSTAGTVTVNVTVATDDNYNALAATPITVTINEKQTQTITADDVTVTFGDTGKSITATTDGGGDLSYAVKSGDAVTVDETTGALTIVKAGSAVITVTAAETATYAQATKDVNITVNQVNSSGEVTAVSGLVYDGTEKALVDSKVHGGILMYRLGTDGEWTEEIPEAADFGTYTVYYYIKGDGNHKDNGSETEPMGSVDVTIKCPYSNEWVDGKWYNKNGSQTYKPLGDWKKDGKDWMYVDTSGWYPKNRWQKIDFKWYFFDQEGHMLKDAYQKSADGKIWYVGKNGAWDEKAAVIGWKQDSKGWWFGLYGKDYLKNTWKMINGNWYYFKADGYVAQNEFVNGWWCNKNGVQRDPVKYSWHKTSKGWWYGVSGGWYAKNATYTIDGKSYTFDKMGYQK